jgi:hypothetical protein
VYRLRDRRSRGLSALKGRDRARGDDRRRYGTDCEGLLERVDVRRVSTSRVMSGVAASL